MAFDPSQPRPTGKIGLPPTEAGMNKIAPAPTKPADDKGKMLGTKPDEADDAKLLERIRKRMALCVKRESSNRKAALEDRKFKGGDQWPSDVAAQRNTDHRPCLTINVMGTLVRQITNPMRENRPGIRFSPNGSKASREAAKVFAGIVRKIEHDCAADIAYDTACDDAVTSGFGYWRYVTEWEKPDSFYQTIVIKRIRNPFTVYLDPYHQEPDGSDCRYAFVTERVPKEEFEEEYPDADPVPFMEGGQGENYKDWIGKDDIRIAEYFEIKHEKKTLVRLDNGFVGWQDELDDLVKAKIERKTLRVVEEREAECPTVMYYKVTAFEVLERSEWLGKWIPIVKVIGNEIDIEGDVKLSGAIRDAKDSQRMMNYWEPLALDTLIPTPDGWAVMRDIHADSTVFNEMGQPVKVLGESPVHINRPCLRITFDDGSSVVCDHKHLWTVEERGKRMTAGHVRRMVTIPARKIDPAKHRIPITRPIDTCVADLPVHPYLLGAWLGDGSSLSNVITQSDVDIVEMCDILTRDGAKVRISRPKERAPYIVVDGLSPHLRSAGVLGNKHIPVPYLRASAWQRWALLQGLMDTDGSISRTGQCSFSTVTPALADGFAELIRSLGIKAVRTVKASAVKRMSNGSDCVTKEEYRFNFPIGPDDQVFRLSRKASRAASQKRHPSRSKFYRIRSVEPAESVPVKCIAVDTPSHLFLCGEAMVPTHNTKNTEAVALAPMAPWLVEEGQIEGYEQQWKNANRTPYPFLQYKGTSLSGKQVPPPQRQPFPGIPAGIQQGMENSRQHIQIASGVMLGRLDPSQQHKVNDESGVAMRESRRTSDIGSFHFADNFTRSLRHGGRILLDLIPKVMDEKRIIAILREDGVDEMVQLDPHANEAHAETSQGPAKPPMQTVNLKTGEYTVTITTGPDYATKRIEAAESMMSFAKAMPQSAQLIADLIAKYQDWEGAEEMAARLAKAVPAQFLTADQKDIPPQVQAMIQNLEQNVKQLQQQLQQAMKALNEKGEDRAIAKSKIEHDFMAKILALVQKAETDGGKLDLAGAEAIMQHIDSQERMEAENKRTEMEAQQPQEKPHGK